MRLDQSQSSIQTALAAASGFAGLAIMLEFDPAATPEELAAQDAELEQALTTQGIAICISQARAQTISQSRHSGLHIRLIHQVAIIENPLVNRIEATGARANVLALLRAGIAALLHAGFEFPDQPLTSPDSDAEGFLLNGLLVFAKDDIRAAAPAS